MELHAPTHRFLFGVTVIIRINVAAFIKFLALKMRRLFEGGVYSRAAFNDIFPCPCGVYSNNYGTGWELTTR